MAQQLGKRNAPRQRGANATRVCVAASWRLALAAVCCLFWFNSGLGSKVRVFPWAVSPAQHPNQQRTWVNPPPGLGPAYGGSPAHFAGYRGGISAAALDAYNASGLGDVVWPQYPVMYTASTPFKCWPAVSVLYCHLWRWTAARHTSLAADLPRAVADVPPHEDQYCA